MTLGKHRNKVARLRARLGETQAVFATRFGVQVSSVYHWEAGTRSPSKACLLIMAIIQADLDTPATLTASDSLKSYAEKLAAQ